MPSAIIEVSKYEKDLARKKELLQIIKDDKWSDISVSDNLYITIC